MSQWAEDPVTEYCLDFYAQIALELLDAFEIRRMRWIGTSMGGALGIRLAADALKDRITHLVINDVGPALAPSAVERILSYTGNPPDFDTIQIDGSGTFDFDAYLFTVTNMLNVYYDFDLGRISGSITECFVPLGVAGCIGFNDPDIIRIR